MKKPPIRLLHPDSSFSEAKLEQFDKLSTEELIESLKPGKVCSLKILEDGTLMDGHHRIKVLMRRGVDVNTLPREIVSKEL